MEIMEMVKEMEKVILIIVRTMSIQYCNNHNKNDDVHTTRRVTRVPSIENKIES